MRGKNLNLVELVGFLENIINHAIFVDDDEGTAVKLMVQL